MDPIRFDADSARLLSEQYKFDESRPLAPILETARGISRQAAASQLRRWVAAGLLQEDGNHRPKQYTLCRLAHHAKTFELNGFDEHVVWTDAIRPLIARYADAAAMRIWDYGATEMLNNAKDHSEGTSVTVSVVVTGGFATMLISDDGEGIFRRLTRLCALPDERLAILELAKGKLTTDPDHHSGEGIFFTSRAFDRFQIHSGDLIFDHTDRHEDMLTDGANSKQGTVVALRLCHFTERSLRTIFDEYTEIDDDEGLSRFNKTVIPVRLARFGSESVVSRSQAQRLLARIERFHTVIFDFADIDTIGQGFADEIFRVFNQQRPEVRLKITNANDDVQYMINRVGGTG